MIPFIREAFVKHTFYVTFMYNTNSRSIFFPTFYSRSSSGFPHCAVTNTRAPYKTNYAFPASSYKRWDSIKTRSVRLTSSKRIKTRTRKTSCFRVISY